MSVKKDQTRKFDPHFNSVEGTWALKMITKKECHKTKSLDFTAFHNEWS